jgi:uncharacterized protein DUF3179
MRKVIVGYLGIIFMWSCSDQGAADKNNGPWLIPIDQVFDGGPGRDGIPAIDNPDKIAVADVTTLQGSDLVVGYFDGEVSVAYPVQILDWHEIVNDNVNSFPLSITYCPLTGTAIGWDRTINGKITTFGVSGLLYNNNLIPFDRGTTSNWSQQRLDCVNGALIGTKIKTFPLVETRWDNWQRMYPDTKVLSENTGFNRSYGTYPYGDYKTNAANLLFPLSIDDGRLHRKERVHGMIIDDAAKVYRFDLFNENTSLINDVVQGEDVVVVGNLARNFIVSFYRTLEDGTMLNFTAVDENNIILKDNLGNKWDIFGFAVSGPLQGQRLKNTESFLGYWFSWGVFYPDAEIHGL